jgi:3(or 17)beta-hydroxysteroid dehydrogenase
MRKVALVTGGASGLGKAIARRLAADGARVIITDIQAVLGRATADELSVAFLEHDVCSEARWHEIVEEVEGHFGQLDILVNNAGIAGPMGNINPETLSLADWKRIFAVNADSVFLGCRTAIAAMRRAGGSSIINISSIAALRATPQTPAYGASKAAVRHLTKSVAQYCAQEKLNVRCNAVHPGYVRTPLWDGAAEEIARKDGTSVDRIIAATGAEVPLGDFTRPEDIAAAVSFLACDDSRHITGTELIVDGGVINCGGGAQ